MRGRAAKAARVDPRIHAASLLAERFDGLPVNPRGRCSGRSPGNHELRGKLIGTDLAVMIDSSWPWALFTVIAAAAQTVRNATQRELTTSLGTVGATHVRFLFGFPFAIAFLAIVLMTSGTALPRPRLVYWPWILDGALAQIAA